MQVRFLKYSALFGVNCLLQETRSVEAEATAVIAAPVTGFGNADVDFMLVNRFKLDIFKNRQIASFYFFKLYN
jgi:hypothetical protein